MEQLRLGFPPRDPSNPLGRLLFGLAALLLGIAGAAFVIFVVLPLLGIIVSAGVVMMIPFMLVAATVLAFMARAETRRPGALRARTHWR